MAKHQVVTYSYTCDVCGGTIPESGADGASRMLSWDGSDYVIDVCESHGSQLGELVAQLRGFVDAGRRETPGRGPRRGPGRPPRSPRRSTSAPEVVAPTAPTAMTSLTAPVSSAPAVEPARTDVAVIRAWARENGYLVNERGRIPAPVMAAYEAVEGGSGRAAVAAPARAAARRRRGGKSATA